MLPGFRLLFAAILLSMSILVFGLGAVALLRAAHEEVASTPSWRAAPENLFARQNEATPPVLAMLRVEPAVAEKAPDDVPAVPPAESVAIVSPPAEPAPVSTPVEPASPVSAPAEPEATVSAPAEPESTAALKPDEASAPETAKSEATVAETAAQAEAIPARTDAPAAADETTIAVSEPIPPPAQVAAPANEGVPAASEPAASEQTSTTVSPEAGMTSTKIATLGGPPVTIGAQLPANAAAVKPDPGAIKKRQRARRAAQRRRMAARARLAQQAQQQPANPFAQPVAPAPKR
jgi:hypothetical protein